MLKTSLRGEFILLCDCQISVFSLFKILFGSKVRIKNIFWTILRCSICTTIVLPRLEILLTSGAILVPKHRHREDFLSYVQITFCEFNNFSEIFIQFFIRMQIYLPKGKITKPELV